MTDIERLINGRWLVDNYRRDKCAETTDRDMTVVLKNMLEQGLSALGFASLDEFFFFDGRMSMLELVRCYIPVNSMTGEENPLCDLCQGREPMGCILSNDTGEVTPEKYACATGRAAGASSTKLHYITEEEDLILMNQKARALSEGRHDTILFSISDMIFFWDFNEHHVSSMKCIAKAFEKYPLSFDPWWNLSKYRLKG